MPEAPTDTMVLVSETPSGPFQMVSFLHFFGEQAYFVNLQSKFISPDGNSAWLCYSANFTNNAYATRWRSDPEGSKYALCLQEIVLLRS